MVERPKSFFQRHSYRGRYEEYRTNHIRLLDQTQGEARYLFEKTLDNDAKKYARKKVATEIIGTALVACSVGILGYEIKHKRLALDFQTISHVVLHPVDMIKTTWNTFLDQSADQLTGRVLARVEKSMPDIVDAASDEFGRKVQVELVAAGAYMSSLLDSIGNAINPLKVFKK